MNVSNTPLQITVHITGWTESAFERNPGRYVIIGSERD